jgi:hypothetical protein
MKGIPIDRISGVKNQTEVMKAIFAFDAAIVIRTRKVIFAFDTAIVRTWLEQDDNINTSAFCIA